MTFEVGKQYEYREDGAFCIVKVLRCEEREKRGKPWLNTEVECVKSIHGGRFGEIPVGCRWVAGAAMTDVYLNAYCGWSMSEARNG